MADGLGTIRRYLDEQLPAQQAVLEGTVLAAHSSGILEKAAKALTGLLGEATQVGVEGGRSGVERQRNEVQTVAHELRLLVVQHTAAPVTILRRLEEESNGGDVLQQQEGRTARLLQEEYSKTLETVVEERQRYAAQEACDGAISSLRQACLDLGTQHQLGTLFRGLVSHLSDLASNLTVGQDKSLDAAIRGAQQCVLGWASMAVMVQESTPESVDVFATGKLAWVSEAVQALDGIAMGLAELRLALSTVALKQDVETTLERLLANIWRLSPAEESSRPSVQAFLQTHSVDGHTREQLEEALRNAFETVFVRGLQSLLLASRSAFGAAAGLDTVGTSWAHHNPPGQKQGAAAVSKMSPPLDLVPFMDFDPHLEGAGMIHLGIIHAGHWWGLVHAIGCHD